MDHAFLFLVLVIGLSVHTIVGLVAIWVGLGRPHWFIRLAVLGGLLSLSLAIPAHDLMILFGLQSAVAILPLWPIRQRASMRRKAESDAEVQNVEPRRAWPQFSLLDLLLATVVVAALVAWVAQIPADFLGGWMFEPVAISVARAVSPPGTDWLSFASMPAAPWVVLGVLGPGLGLSTLVGAWAGLGERCRWWRCASVCLLPTSMPMAAWLGAMRSAGWTGQGPGWSAPLDESLQKTPRRQRALCVTGRLAVFFVGGLLLLPAVGAYCIVVYEPPIPEVKLPVPNGYDRLTEAVGPMSDFSLLDLKSATKSQLRDFLAKHEAAIGAVRAALAEESRVPLTYTRDDLVDDWAGPVDLRIAAAWAFHVEGRVAESEERHVDAVDSYLDCIRLARKASQGGLITDWLDMSGIEGLGVADLIAMRRKFPAERLGLLIETQQSLDADRETWADVCRRQEIWTWIVGGWQTRLEGAFRWAEGSGGYVEPQFLGLPDNCSPKRSQTRMRLLVCDLAIRLYRQEEGADPEELADLVPEYLPAVPEDPFSGRPLVYRRTETGYLLYSVGPDETDNGGEVFYSDGYLGLISGDLLLDTPTTEPQAGSP